LITEETFRCVLSW